MEFRNGTLSVLVPTRLPLLGGAPFDLEIRVPSDSACEVVTASADVRCTGQLGRLKSRSASGDLDADVINGPVVVNTASGDVMLRDITGPLRVHSASGGVMAERAGDEVTVRTASGDVRIEDARASVRARSSSGDVRIGAVSSGRAEITTMSGDIAVGVAAGIDLYLDLSALSGQVRSELEPSGHDGGVTLTLLCHSVSGDVLVSRATEAQAR